LNVTPKRQPGILERRLSLEARDPTPFEDAGNFWRAISQAATIVMCILMLGVLLLVIGVVRIVMAFGMKGHAGWIWPALSGVLSLVLGFMIISKWPASGLWVIGLFVAIELIIQGWSCIFLALAARNVSKGTTTGKLAA